MTKILILRDGTELLLDEEDYARAVPRRWRKEVTRTGTVRVVGDFKIDKKWRKVSLERFIFDLPSGQRILRIPGSQMYDYRKQNFFLGSASELKRRTGKPRGDHSSRYKGVYSFAGRWRATLQVEKRTVSLGLFDTEAEAAIAYDRAVDFYFGSSAFKNFGFPGRLP